MAAKGNTCNSEGKSVIVNTIVDLGQHNSPQGEKSWGNLINKSSALTSAVSKKFTPISRHLSTIALDS